MLALTVLILAFVGTLTVINMRIGYDRDFERTAKNVLDPAKLDGISGKDKLCEYLESSLALFSESTDYYLLEGGNIIRSSKSGGMLEMTDTLSEMLGTSGSEKPKRVLDMAQNSGGYTLYLIDSREQLRNNILDISLLFLQALIFGVVLAAVISFFISSHLTRSIKDLEKGAKRMSEGEFCRIPVTTDDEIGTLCNVFNEMARQIQSDYDQFERVEDARREFVANVSHELKTPLTVIKSYSETLANTQVDTQTAKKFLEIIDSEADRMSDMVSQLLLLSRLEEKAEPKTICDFDLGQLCQSIAGRFELEAKKKEISIRIRGSAKIQSDQSKVKTILINLISNAVNYSKAQSTIYVDIHEKSVAVCNSGETIPSEHTEHLFERFYRVDKARSRQTGGTGLGLAIAKECADAIGARLSVQSESGETKFILEF